MSIRDHRQLCMAPINGLPLPKSEFPRHMTVRECCRRLAAKGLYLNIDRHGLRIVRMH